jgi:hypothetical protein
VSKDKVFICKVCEDGKLEVVERVTLATGKKRELLLRDWLLTYGKKAKKDSFCCVRMEAGPIKQVEVVSMATESAGPPAWMLDQPKPKAGTKAKS